jgi:hypothetical protein
VASGPPPAKELVNDGFAFVGENYAEYSPTASFDAKQ